MQEDTLAVVDTLTQAYADQWSGPAVAEDAGAFIQFMSSNELIYVVLGVSLIIWAVLLFFLFRVDKKVSKLEEQIKSSKEA
ncbi:MAG: CcmD family protein [Balneolaceae bacterium]